MRLLEIETVPVWERPSGERSLEWAIGVQLAGYSNVLVIELNGERRRFLACHRVAA